VKSFKAEGERGASHPANRAYAETAAAYGRRFAAISSDSFHRKVPADRRWPHRHQILRTEGIPVNFTRGFSARQNHLRPRSLSPAYVNVFLGRLNAYVSEQRAGRRPSWSGRKPRWQASGK